MNEIKLKGIVLSSIDYKEKDKIVKLFTLEQGIISAVLRGVRQSKAKLKFAAQPFSFGNFMLVSKGEYNIITNLELQDSFFDLTKNIDNYYISFSLLEVVQASLMQNEPNGLVFVNLLKALKQICYENTNAKLVLLKFILGMLKVLGYKMSFKTCNSCKLEFVNKKYINLNTGDLVCGSCVTNNCLQISNSTFSLIKVVYSTAMENIHTVNTTGNILNETLNAIIKNFEYRTERRLKTIKQFI